MAGDPAEAGADDPFASARRIVNLGNELEAQGDVDAALARYREAAATAPTYARAHVNIGNALQLLGRLDEAVRAQLTARDIDPRYAPARFNLGLLYQAQGKLDAAERELRESLQLAPGMADAAIALADVYESGGRADEGEQELRHALRIDPRHPGALYNLGIVLHVQGRHDEALACFSRAARFDPAYAQAHYAESLCRLLTGDFEAGWRKHEWRWSCGQFKGGRRDFAQPLWLGEQPVAGRTVLIHAEQGLGDFIQFCRYAPMVEALGARVVLELPAALMPLIATLKGNFELVEQNRPLPAFDVHCPVMSLPLAFRTDLASIPATVPYLDADPGRRTIWRQRLGPRTRPRVGLVWSGSPLQRDDHRRSMPLPTLEPLLQLPFEFHVLQSDIRASDEPFLANCSELHDHRDELRDFADTAALVMEMDLVISVCTSVAHLAGALGKPVWILLPFPPDWRWLLDREDSPWYPSARLFRQPSTGDWAAVLRRVAQALEGIAGT